MRGFETHRNFQAWRHLGLTAFLLTALTPAGCKKSVPELRVQAYRDRLAASMGDDRGKPMMLPVYPGGPAHYTLEEQMIDDTMSTIATACKNTPFPDVTQNLITKEGQRPAHVFSLHDPASGTDRVYNANDASLLVIELREQYQTIRKPEDQMTCLHDLTDYLDELTQSAVQVSAIDNKIVNKDEHPTN